MEAGCCKRQNFFQFLSYLVIIPVVAPQITYPIDPSVGLGRRFDGIGAISGGGATSHLLVNYPEPERSQILDYLFKPNFGASLHIFKVEIGGDAQSSEGTESSHMHKAGIENYHRGYEWWMMKEAKKRNPDMLLYGLPWGFPGWLGEGSWWPYKNPNNTAQYIINWVKGAKKFHNLTINYVGIWNEKPYDITYIKTLRQQLNSNGLSHVKIVAADAIGPHSWDIVKDMTVDQQFNNSVDIVGGHYTFSQTTNEAKHVGKPLWSSEDSSQEDSDIGAACLGKLLNENYVNGFMTSTIVWNILAAYYDDLPYRRHSLMTANQPWSGYYKVAPPMWTTAHTTQFTQPGWTYLSHKAGVGFLEKGGSYVSLISPNKKEFSLIIETIDVPYYGFCASSMVKRTSSQRAIFVLKGNLKQIHSLHLWQTKFDFQNNTSTYFKYAGSLKVVDGLVKLNLEVDSIYTLTTVSKGYKGNHSNPPSPGPFPLPYSDNFEKYLESKEAFNFAQQVGVFEIHSLDDLEHGKVMRQVLQGAPLHWCPLRQSAPINVIGNYTWSNVNVSVDVKIPSFSGTRGVFLGARVDQGGCTTYFAQGLFFFLLRDGTFVISTDLERSAVVKTGSFPLQLDSWYRIGLSVQDSTVIAIVDETVLFSSQVEGKTSHGFVALGADTFGLADFDNFLITPP